MLVLTVRVGRRVHIGPDIYVEVLEKRDQGQQVRLGVVAPPEVKVLREEVLAQMGGRAAVGWPKPEGGAS